MKQQLMILAAIAVANGFGAIRAVTPQIPDSAWTKDWWMPRHLEKMGAVTNGGAKVVLLGDSITHYWEDAGRIQFSRYFSQGDFRALDLGFSGDRTEHVLWRITEGRELDGYEAKAVVLMIGTNNAGHFPFEQEPPIDTILGVREVLRTIRVKQPKAKIVMCAIFPRGRDQNDPIRLRNEVVNNEIRKFADGVNVFWCDFNDQFLSADGRLSGELFPDYLHPSQYGYEIWANAVMPYVAAAVEGRQMPLNRYSQHPMRGLRIDETLALFPHANVGNGGCQASDWWVERLLRNRNQIADSKGEIDLVFFGDSITHNWENPGKETLAELQKTYSILNLGYSGDKTENLLWRGENGELDGYKAKGVMLMIGTNNTWHRRDSAEDIAAGIRAILSLLQRKQPQAKVLLLPIFPFGEGPEHPNRVNNDIANALIRRYADGKRVIWVDFNAKFLDERGDNVKWMPDHCHPNAAGYKEIWLPAVLPYFKEICGK